MGFERLVSVIQDRSSNYDTDIFEPLFKKIQELTGARPYEGRFGKDDEDGVETVVVVMAVVVMVVRRIVGSIGNK